MKDFLAILYEQAKAIFSEYVLIMKEQSASIIFFCMIGLVSFILLLADPESQVGSSSLKLMGLVISGGGLIKPFFLVSCFFLFCSALLKLLEPSSQSSKSFANVAIKGISALIVPLAAYSILLAILFLLALTESDLASKIELISNKNSYSLLVTGFYGAFVIPAATILCKKFILSAEGKLQSAIFLSVSSYMMISWLFELLK